jgi:hypothetical protein
MKSEDDFPSMNGRTANAAPALRYREYSRDEYQQLTGCRSFRRWRNPTRSTARFEMHVDFAGRRVDMSIDIRAKNPRLRPNEVPPDERVDHSAIPVADRVRTVIVAPGAELDLPKSWDVAIRTVVDGRVQGGVCPWLEPLGVAPIPLHDAMREGREHGDGVPEPFEPPTPPRAA